MAISPDAAPELVHVERRSGWHIVQMMRPQKRNAMNRQGRKELLKAFEDAAEDGARVVVLTGSEGSFCSGIDLRERNEELAAGMAADPRSDWMEVLMAIRNHPAVFIAAVNGLAMGGGSALINVCDLGLSCEEAWISSPEMSFGAFSHFSGPASMYQVLPKHAAWLLYTTERIDGRTAAAWGFVNECVDAKDLMTRADAIASQIARFDAAALTETKRALDATPGATRDWRLAFEAGMGTNARIREKSANAQLGPERYLSSDTMKR